MIIRVNYLGPLRAITGKGEEEIELKERAKLGDLFDVLRDKYGMGFERHLSEATGETEGATLILINGKTLKKHKEFLGQFLSEHDFLSILPLYSGG